MPWSAIFGHQKPWILIQIGIQPKINAVSGSVSNEYGSETLVKILVPKSLVTYRTVAIYI